MKDYDKNKESSQFNECFIESYIEGYFLKLMFNILKSYMSFITIYQFYQKE